MTEATSGKQTSAIYRPQTALVVIKEEGVRRHVKDHLVDSGIKVYESNDYLGGVKQLREDLIDIMITGEDRNLESLVRYVERGSGRQGVFTLAVNSRRVPESEGIRIASTTKQDGEADVMFSDYVQLITYLNDGKLIPDYMTNPDAQHWRNIAEQESKAMEQKFPSK